jgi:hypothetical protein
MCNYDERIDNQANANLHAILRIIKRYNQWIAAKPLNVPTIFKPPASNS